MSIGIALNLSGSTFNKIIFKHMVAQNFISAQLSLCDQSEEAWLGMGWQELPCDQT